METKMLFPDEFFKQFETGNELLNFLKELKNRGIEKILIGELYTYIYYYKSDLRKGINTRNGYSIKKIKTSYGEEKTKVSRDPDASSKPMHTTLYFRG